MAYYTLFLASQMDLLHYFHLFVEVLFGIICHPPYLIQLFVCVFEHTYEYHLSSLSGI